MGFDFNKMLAWKLRAGSHKFRSAAMSESCSNDPCGQRSAMEKFCPST